METLYGEHAKCQRRFAMISVCGTELLRGGGKVRLRFVGTVRLRTIRTSII